MLGVKTLEVFINEELEYKVKGTHRYIRHRVVNLRDSLIVFDNDSVVVLRDLKAIKLRDQRHLLNVFGKFMQTFGVLFIGLNTVNNVIFSREPVVDKRSGGIAAGIIGTGLVLRYFSAKRIRINKHTVLKVTEIKYSGLNNH
ncbi:MAG: hypothetical protein K0S12_352 [Bacteroidetes bacterium]|nr:hypothetical protein [Bacteroidota bacterium]